MQYMKGLFINMNDRTIMNLEIVRDFVDYYFTYIFYFYIAYLLLYLLDMVLVIFCIYS